MPEHTPEIDAIPHALPMAWTLRPTARLYYVLARCTVADCEVCGRVKAEIIRRGDPINPPASTTGGV